MFGPRVSGAPAPPQMFGMVIEMAKYPDQTRNLNPHAEAKMAMWLWGAEYAAQGGGSMDFWDRLSDSRKRVAKNAVDDILEIANKGRRFVVSHPSPVLERN